MCGIIDKSAERTNALPTLTTTATYEEVRAMAVPDLTTLSGRQLGAFKSAAKKVGLSLAEYGARMANGQKWCTRCRGWLPRCAFKSDLSRWDGLAASCGKCRRAIYTATYVRRSRVSKRGARFVPARDGDKFQARGRVNGLVTSGTLPAPDDIPCTDCGHEAGPGGRRHEYDHHLGYGAAHHDDVQAVCTTCHVKREIARGAFGGYQRAAHG